jgi:GT2 family glycosyltransferase
MIEQPLVSVITVNYNQPSVTADMLRSLSQLLYKNIEVIVVDNASEHSSSVLKKEFPFITHITSPVNLGFAGGNNIGLSQAKGDYVFFINNDTELTPGIVHTLVEYMLSHPECAIACPKIKYHFKPDTIQYAGAIGLHPLTSRSYDIGYMQKDDGSFSDTRKTDLPNGAAMMVPMKLIRQIGPMSEMFFLYYEELDWAARFKKAGYEIHYVGIADIFHKESVSTGKNSAFKTYYIYRNRLLYIRRNYSGIRWFISSAFFTCISTPVHMLKHGVKREWKHISSIWKALIWNLNNKPFKEPALNSENIKTQLVVE